MATISKDRGRRIVAGLGGAPNIRKGLQKYSDRVEQMEALRPALTKQHPEKWVAMGDDAIVAIADSLNALLEEVDKLGISRVGLVVEHLNTRPRNLIL